MIESTVMLFWLVVSSGVVINVAEVINDLTEELYLFFLEVMFLMSDLRDVDVKELFLFLCRNLVMEACQWSDDYLHEVVPEEVWYL